MAGLLPLAVIIFLGFSSIGVPLPALPIEVTEQLGFGAVAVGWVIGLQSLVTVVTRQIAGRIADSRGPKRSVLFGLPAAALAGVLYLLSTMVGDHGTALALLLVGRAILGFAESLFLTGAMTWGIARLGVHRAGRVMAWQGIAMFTALSLGGPVGVFVMERYGFRAIALTTIVLPLIGGAIALAIPAAEAGGGKRAPFWHVIGLIWRHGVALLLAAIPYATLIAFVTLFYRSHGWEGAGYALAGFGIGYILVRLFLAHLPDRAGALVTVAVTLVVEAAGMVVLAFAGSPLVAFAGATLTGVGFSLVFPSLGAEAVRRVSPQDRGSAVGGFNAFLDVALGLTGPLMGVLLGFGGFPLIYGAGAVAALAALGLALLLRRAG